MKVVVRLLGGIHGLAGLATVVAWLFFLNSELATGYGPAVLAFGTVTVAASAFYLFMCAWTAWHLSQRAHIFAWQALAAYLIPAWLAGDPRSLMHLMSAFYYSVGVRVLAALVLWWCTRSVLRPSGNG